MSFSKCFDRPGRELTPHQGLARTLRLTQEDIALRLGISQHAYAQQENVAKPRKATREKIAAAFDIKADQLEL